MKVEADCENCGKEMLFDTQLEGFDWVDVTCNRCESLNTISLQRLISQGVENEQ